MAREDVYGAALAELLITTEQPLTMTEAAELVGCSRQRAFAWADMNKRILVAVAQGDRKAVRYMARGNPHLMTWQGNHRATEDDESERDITIGTSLTVTSMSVKNGRVVLTLTGLQGEQVEAVMV